MAVKSPCIDVCAFDGKTKLCIGCFRTLDEIRGWKKMTDHLRHQVINDRARRQTKLQREAPELPVGAATLNNSIW
jgi:predicted Fe-S protein YdhL (DUF1289 family)